MGSIPIKCPHCEETSDIFFNRQDNDSEQIGPKDGEYAITCPNAKCGKIYDAMIKTTYKIKTAIPAEPKPQ